MLLRLLIPLLLIAAGCGLPRVPIRQTFDRQGTFEAGGSRVHAYAARDFRRLDSSARILRMEYLPVQVFAVVDERDSIDRLVVAAWTELLWRFSEKLAPTDKDYFAPVPMNVARAGDSVVITWGYPSVDTRDDDLRDITPYRNSYWSVDVYRRGSARDEIFRGDLRSHPQYSPYDPLRRFVAGGTYERALADSAPPMSVLRTYLTNPPSDGVDTARGR